MAKELLMQDPVVAGDQKLGGAEMASGKDNCGGAATDVEPY